jgi:hypothetical protein
MNETLTVHPQTFDYYSFYVIANLVLEEEKPVIQSAYAYEENGVYYCTSATQKGVYRYSYARNCPLMYTDPDGEFAWFVPIIVGAVMGAVQGAMIAKSAGATGWDFAAYMFMGAGIGAITGAIGGGMAAGIGGSMAYSAAGLVGAVAGGTVSGAFSGAGFTALAGGDPLRGMWTGAVSGLAGSLVGSGIGGGVGAFFGGATSGAVGTALNGGSGKDILKSALIGGVTSFSAYQLQQAAGYWDYKRAGGEWNYRQYYKISVVNQRSFAWGREGGGWITDKNVGKIVYGEADNVKLPPKPNNAKANFHTHPHNPEGIEWHSIADVYGEKNINYVIGWENMYKHNPQTHSFYRYYTSVYTVDHLMNTLIPSLLTTYNNNLNPYPFYLFYFGH